MTVTYGTIDVAYDTYANAAALAAVDTTDLFNGSRAIIESLGVFKLDIDSTATANNTTVIAAAGGGNWLLDSTSGAVLTSDNKIAPFQVGESGNVGLDDGTASSPSLYFTDDSDTGIYRVGANTLGFTADGTKELEVGASSVTVTTQLFLPDGSAGTPSFRVASEASGMYLSSAGNLSFSIAGAPHMTLSATGVDFQNGDTISVDGTQVVGARQTGWTIMTGTAERGTFATSSVTLEQLAGVVLALQEDLGTGGHGLIDA